MAIRQDLCDRPEPLDILLVRLHALAEVEVREVGLDLSKPPLVWNAASAHVAIKERLPACEDAVAIWPGNPSRLRVGRISVGAEGSAETATHAPEDALQSGLIEHERVVVTPVDWPVRVGHDAIRQHEALPLDDVASLMAVEEEMLVRARPVDTLVASIDKQEAVPHRAGLLTASLTTPTAMDMGREGPHIWNPALIGREFAKVHAPRRTLEHTAE